MYHTGNQGCSFDIPYKKLHVGKEIPVLSMKIILTSLFYQKASRDGLDGFGNMFIIFLFFINDYF